MGLVDLDELALRCRDQQARQYIQEAVACYKAGAFRSCIVSTWNAVVFDFLHKLRELDLAGDKNAQTKLKEFDRIRAGGESMLKNALDFEREVLNVAARDFELLTPLEKLDLERLRMDRSRCAHPSMQSPDDPYQPTAELARGHLRNAVEIMLEREPVQGKSALDRILAEIESPYFPTLVEDAKAHFCAGPLKRARKALIRAIVIVLVKGALKDVPIGDHLVRVRSALAAVIELHRAVAEEVIRVDSPGIVASVDDHMLWRIAVLAAKIPLTWEVLGAAVRGKVCAFVANAEEENGGLLRAIVCAMKVPDLKSVALARVDALSYASFAKLVSASLPEWADRAIREYEQAGSFRIAERVGEELVLPLAAQMSAIQVRRVLHAVQKNHEIYDAIGTQDHLCRLLDTVNALHADTRTEWQALLEYLQEQDAHGGLGVTHHYSELRVKMEAAGMWPVG